MTVLASPWDLPSLCLHFSVVICVLLPSNTPHHLLKNLLNVVSQSSRCFKEWTTKLFRHQLSLIRRDLTTIFEVTLISGNHHGNSLVVTDTIDHLFVATDLLEASLVCYGVDQDEPLTSSHVLLSHCCEFILNVVWKED